MSFDYFQTITEFTYRNHHSMLTGSTGQMHRREQLSITLYNGMFDNDCDNVMYIKMKAKCHATYESNFCITSLLYILHST